MPVHTGSCTEKFGLDLQFEAQKLYWSDWSNGLLPGQMWLGCTIESFLDIPGSIMISWQDANPIRFWQCVNAVPRYESLPAPGSSACPSWVCSHLSHCSNCSKMFQDLLRFSLSFYCSILSCHPYSFHMFLVSTYIFWSIIYPDARPYISI